MKEYKGYQIPDTYDEIAANQNAMNNDKPRSLLCETLSIYIDGVTFNTNISIERFAAAKTDSEKQEIVDLFVQKVSEFIDWRNKVNSKKSLEDNIIKEIRECCEKYIKENGPCTAFSCSCKFKDFCEKIAKEEMG